MAGMLDQLLTGGDPYAPYAMGPMGYDQPMMANAPLSAPVAAPTGAPTGVPQAAPGGKGFGQAIKSGIQSGRDSGLFDRMAMGFNTMRLTPDPYIAQAANRRLQTRQLLQRQADIGNKTADYFEKQGDTETAKLIRANPEMALQLMLINAQKKPQETFTQFTQDGRLFNRSDLTGKITAAGGGDSNTTISMGDTMSPGREAVDKAYAPKYIEWREMGGVDMASQMAQIGTALSTLQEAYAGGQDLSGPVVGQLPRWMRNIVASEGVNVQEQIEEVVQRNLRTVLGAQFAEKEGDRLISRAYNPALGPEHNIPRVQKLFEQLSKAAEAKEAMAQYFEQNETLMGYDGPTVNPMSFYDALGGLPPGEAPAAEAMEESFSLIVQTFSPEDQQRATALWNKLSDEDKMEYLRQKGKL